MAPAIVRACTGKECGEPTTSTDGLCETCFAAGRVPVCPDCGACDHATVFGPDEEGFWDCHGCGAAWKRAPVGEA